MIVTIIDRAILDMLHARAQFILWDQRHRRGNLDWFTADEIADHFGERPPTIPLSFALKALAAAGVLEYDGEHRVRHA